jgi:creatinine amidohydrolase
MTRACSIATPVDCGDPLDLVQLTSAHAAALPDDAIGLIALGAIEQHGPHLPLGTDMLLAQELARRVAESSSRPFVIAPVPGASLSQHHLSFAGTVTLDEETLRGHLDALVAAYTRMGLDQVAIFSAHGGNFSFLESYGRAQPNVLAFSDRRRFFAVATEAAREVGLDVPATDEHAGVIETSQALAVFPTLVGDHQDAQGLVEPFDGWEEKMFHDGLAAVSPNGVLGDPRAATAVAGEHINDALANMLIKWIEERLAIR